MQKISYKPLLLLGLSLSAFLISCEKESSDPEPVASSPFAVSTFAGSVKGTADGTGSSAQFFDPWDIAMDGVGNFYVTDHESHRIRKITPAGVVTTLAGSTEGSADGMASSAQFQKPTAVAVDAQGNLYVTEYDGHRIRKITPGGEVTTIAGNGTAGYKDATGTNAVFDTPSGIAVDASGNLYVSDRDNQRIRKISPAGVVSTLAGSGAVGKADGAGTAAQFNSPSGLAMDDAGNLYVADTDNHLIRKITPEGVVSTVAGNGTAGFADGNSTSAQFNYPWNVAYADGILYVADYFNHRIRMIDADGVVSTVAGNGSIGNTDGNGARATFNYPGGIVVAADGSLYITDNGNYLVRQIVRE